MTELHLQLASISSGGGERDMLVVFWSVHEQQILYKFCSNKELIYHLLAEVVMAEELPPYMKPLFMSGGSQKIFDCVADEQVSGQDFR